MATSDKRKVPRYSGNKLCTLKLRQQIGKHDSMLTRQREEGGFEKFD